MELRTKKQKILPSYQKRLSEIAEILVNGICRLEAKERYQNQQILVDNNYSPSLHSVDLNLNQQVTRYE